MPNTEHDYLQQIHEYQHQKLWVWDKLLVIALILAVGLLVLALAQVGAQEHSTTRSPLILGMNPTTKIIFFDNILTIHDSGEIYYQTRKLTTDEEIWHGLQELIGLYFDREKTCSRRDALLALQAARQLLSGSQAAAAIFHEGYAKCFPAS